MLQGRGRAFRRRAVQAHGPGLEQNDLVVLVHGPFQILGILVVALQFQGHGGQPLHLLAAETGHVAQCLGHVHHLAFHGLAPAHQNQPRLLVGDGFTRDLAGSPRNQPLVGRA